MKYRVEIRERCTNFWEVEVKARDEAAAKKKAIESFAEGKIVSGEVDEVGVFSLESLCFSVD